MFLYNPIMLSSSRIKIVPVRYFLSLLQVLNRIMVILYVRMSVRPPHWQSLSKSRFWDMSLSKSRYWDMSLSKSRQWDTIPLMSLSKSHFWDVLPSKSRYCDTQ